MQILSTWISLESLPIFKKKIFVKTMFTLTVFKILLFEGSSVLLPAKWVTGSGSFSFSNLKYFSPSQFLASSNSRGYHWILKFLVATLKIKWLGGKNVRLFPVCVSVLRYFISNRIALHFFSCTNTLLNISW